MFQQVPGTNKELSQAARQGYSVSPLSRLTSTNLSSLNQSLNSSQNQPEGASNFVSPIAAIFNKLKSQGGNLPQLTCQAANQHGESQTHDSDNSVHESHNRYLNRNEQGIKFNDINYEKFRKNQLSRHVLESHDSSNSQPASFAPPQFDVRSVGPGEELYISRKSQQVSLGFRESFDEAFNVVKNKPSRFILSKEEKAVGSEQLHYQEEDLTEHYSLEDGGEENFILLEENEFYSLDKEDKNSKENNLNGKHKNSGNKHLGRKRKKEVRSKMQLTEKQVNTETSDNEECATTENVLQQMKNYDVAILGCEETQPPRNKETIQLHKWIIKPVTNSKGVFVEGMKNNSDQFWHSSAILKRISAKTVLSNSGTVYKLVGNIIKLDTLNAGYPIEVVNAFKHGFPKDWQEILQQYCNPDQIKKGTNEKKEKVTKKQNAKSPDEKIKMRKTESAPGTPTSTSTSQFEVCTPTGQIINIKNLNRTKCGRLVKPVLSWWIGQSITESGDDIQVTCNTKSGEMELTALKDQVKNSKMLFGRRELVKSDASFIKNSSPTANKTDTDNANLSKSPAMTVNFKSKNSSKVMEDKRSKDAATYFDVQKEINDIIQHHQEKVKCKRKPKRNTCYNNMKASRPSNSSDVFSVDHAGDDFKEEKLQQGIRATKNIKKPNPDSCKSLHKIRTKTNVQTITGAGEGAKNNKSVEQKKSVSKQQPSGRLDRSVKSNIDTKNPAENKMEQSLSQINLIDFSQKRVTRSMDKEMSSSKSAGNNNSVLYENNSEKLETIAVSDTAENGTQKGKNLESRTKKGKGSSASGRVDGTNKKDDQVLDKTKSRGKENGTWQKDEVQKLVSAVNEIKQGHTGYWEAVANYVGTRSVQECQGYYYREFPQVAKIPNEESKKGKKKVTQLTGKAGSMKRKMQLRDFLDQQQEGYSEDLFDATPFRSFNKRQKLNDNTMKMTGANMKDEDSIFDDLINSRSSLHSRFQTPLIQTKNSRFLNLASEKKTPAVISNAFTPSVVLDRKTADHIIYKFKQKKVPRRLIETQKKAPKGKKTKASDIPNKSLFVKSAPDVLQLFQKKQNDSMEIHHDSDEEQDFYWSDQD